MAKNSFFSKQKPALKMRQFNISVIGLSGSEKERGQAGVGKSCLCNRFMRPTADDYFPEHISVLSQSDFSGRIINNDHFLYWGDVRKTTDDNVAYNFHIIEQTEFVDDSTFQTFKAGKNDAYTKRCTATKVFSAEKLMYICKNQLGVEKEYEQKVLPDGRLSVDGFIVVYDVSEVRNRNNDKQLEFLLNVITAILKNKKPLVLVTTKNDEAVESFVREAEKIAQRKEFKNLVPLVETSAHESINIDTAFLLLAQIIDKVKNRIKIIPYQEAYKSRKELLDARSEAVARLIRSQITDYHVMWSQASKMLLQYREWNEFVSIFGQDTGQQIFRRHMKKLRDDHLNRKLHQYLDKFALALQCLSLSTNAFDNSDEDAWEQAKLCFQNHAEFDQYFFECPDSSWTELADMDEMEDDARIPFDVLETPDAEIVFRNYLNSVQQDKKKISLKQQFKLLLEESGFVTPGKQLSEVRVLFMGRDCFELLSEHDCQQIYDLHQDEIIEKAKQNLIELLLEHVQVFFQFKIGEFLTSDDLRQFTDIIQDDPRYKILDRLDYDRQSLLLHHLHFLRNPSRESCPFYHNCVENLIDELLSDKSCVSFKGSNRWNTSNSVHHTLNLLIVGSEHLASDLLNDIRICTGAKGEYIYENQTYYLNYRIANGDMEAFKAIDVYSSGLICVYSNHQSFETLKDNLERTLLCNLELEDKFENLPIVLVYQPQDLKEHEVEILRSEGLRLSEMLHCDFIGHTQNHQKHVYDILNIVILSLRLTEMKEFETIPPNHIDLRILLSMFCGDQYDIENVLSPLIAESTLVKANEHAIIVDVFIGDSKKRVEFILSSCHSAGQYNKDVINGYMYFYSAKRRSSLTNLSFLATQNPNIPMLIIALTDSSGANAFFNSDICQLLITEGNSLADLCKGGFMTFSSDQFIKFAFYSTFLKSAWDNKYDVEIQESLTLDSGEGTLDNSINQVPRPPPRLESYMLSSALGTDGSGSENYDMLPTRSLNSLDEMPESESGVMQQAPDMRRTTDKGLIWNNFGSAAHAYTTGRRHLDSSVSKIRPKGPSQTLKQPGKLNMKNFQLVSDVVAKMKFDGGEMCMQSFDSAIDKEPPNHFGHSSDRTQLSAGDEDVSEEFGEYEPVYDNEDCTESDSCASSTEHKARHQNAYYKASKKELPNKKTKKKKVAIPVQTPRVPHFGSYVSPPEIPSDYIRMTAADKCVKDLTTNDKPSESFQMLPELAAAGNSNEMTYNLKRLKEFEKLEKRKQKEESAKQRKQQEKEKEQEKKLKRKLKQNSKSLTNNLEMQFGKLMVSDKSNIPIFLQRCVEFIEKEGLELEGIYRVPGSRPHVDTLLQRFEEDSNTVIEELDIPVNAVATALKEFFSKRMPPLFSPEIMQELEDIAGSRSFGVSKLHGDMKTDRSCRLMALKALLNKLPPVNFGILKYIFQHFVHVSDNSKLNSMDSKNLAICWWPTLIPIEFKEMIRFEQLRPHLEDMIQTMIDQYPYLFCDKDAFVMV